MSYKEWVTVIETATKHPNIRARIWNVENEYRAKKQVSNYRRRLGYHYNKAKKSGIANIVAAKRALDAVIDETTFLDSKWLGHLPVKNRTDLPNEMYSHVLARDFVRYGSKAAIDPKNPPRKAKFDAPHMYSAAIPVKRFIWVTFEPDGTLPNDDPTNTVKELGLAHYPSGEFIYRFFLDVSADKLFIPTCMDAGLYEAWSPPPINHAGEWGMTRDLSTGVHSKPELLTETTDHVANRPEVELVSPPNIWEQVRSVTTDFMVNRK